MLAAGEVRSFFDVARPVVLALPIPMAIFIVASFLPTVWGIHVGVLFAVGGSITTFFFLNPVQSAIEEMPYGPAQVCVSFPFIVVVLCWMIALVFLDRVDSVSKIVPGFLLAVVTGIWPIFRKSRDHEVQKRRMRYVTSAIIATGVYLILIIAGFLS